MLCDNLEGWDEGEGEVQERGGVCILGVDSHCCMEEANTIL